MNLDMPHNIGQQKPEHSQVSLHNLLTLSMLLVALWLLLYPYAGIRHDARLYTLQALAHLNPELYGRDIFLRFGSQDKYTIFTPIYAQLCTWMDVEHAAALLTALGQLGFLAACWFLTKRLAGSKMAAWTLGLVLILPGNYGSDYVFTYLETFITPRLFGEALALFSIGCFIAERWSASAALLLLALLLHPIMAAAGAAFISVSLALQRPKHAVSFGLVGLAIAIPLLLSPLSTGLRFDSEWLTPIAQRSPYLFIHTWAYADWARLSVPLVTLLLSTLLSPTTQQRTVAKAAVLTALGGLLLTLLGSDIGWLILVTQGQAWRWLWLSTLLALLLVLPLLQMLWTQGKAGQTTGLLLISAWLVRNEASSLGLAILAVSAGLSCYRGIGTEKTWHKAWLGSWAILASTIAWMLAINLLTAGLLLSTYHVPNWLDKLRGICTDGFLPLCLVGLTYAALNSRRLCPHRLIFICTGMFCLTMAWFYWPNWHYEEYPPSLVAAMDTWRQHIPIGEEVLWLNGPTPNWMLLKRPNYISGIQTTVALFSRAAAMTLKQRTAEIQTIFPNSKPLTWTGQEQANTPITRDLRDICAHINVKFLVTNEVLDSPPLAIAPNGMPIGYKQARLYQCKDKS